MVTLFWGNKDRFECVGMFPNDEVHARMMDYLEEIDPDFEVYYIRSWEQNGVMRYDYGDWSNFFYSVPFGISFP